MAVTASPPVLASSPTNRHLDSEEDKKAQGILDEVRASVQSSVRIIPERTFIRDGKTEMSIGFKNYGAGRFLKLLKYNDHAFRVRDTIKYIVEQMGDRIKAPLTVQRLAAARFGVGECGEVTTLIALKAKLAGLRDVCIIYLYRPDTLDPAYNHCLTLYGKGVHKEIRDHRKVVNNMQFKVLKTAKVLDGFLLEKVIPASKIYKSQAMTKYFKEREITKVMEIDFLDIGKEDIESLMDVVKTVATVAGMTLYAARMTITPHPNIVENETWVCAEELTNKIPDSKWSKNAKEKKIWFEGTQDRANDVSKYLQEHGIKASEPKKAKSGSWIVIVDKPDFDLIEKLPSFKEWSEKALVKA